MTPRCLLEWACKGLRLMLMLMLGTVVQTALAQQARVLDDFSDAAAWNVTASDQVQARAERAADGALCLRYDFGAVSGYAVLHRKLAIELPPHYAFTLRLRGGGPVNAFQFKLVDASGDNVWWMNRPAFQAPAASTDLLVRKRQIGFAWGPTDQRELQRAATLEFVVARQEGGAGELCFERLELRTLPAPAPAGAGSAAASSALEPAARAFDGDAATAWISARAGLQHWQVDFGGPREFSGVLLRWAAGARASDFDLQLSDDGRSWRTLHRVRASQREVLPLWLPDSEARYLRVLMRDGPKPRYALAEVQVMDPAQWPTLDAALHAMAQVEPRGRYPRAYLGEQNYWTLVGVDAGAANSALMSEDGALEPRRAGPSIEPFVIDGGGRVVGTWAGVDATHTLRDGYLPLPQVRWSGHGYTLDVEAGADGPPERPELVARYTLTNTSEQTRTLTLALALRPWQVNPPTQFLNTPGGVSPVRRVAWSGDTLQVDGRAWLQTPVPPDDIGAAAFDRADALDLAARGGLPALAPGRPLEDPQGLASAVLRWRFVLPAGESRRVALVLPLAHDAAPQADPRSAEQRLDAIASAWRERLNRVGLALPPAAQPLHDTLRSALAQILISRAGAALQPGTRSYARSWVRDGAMMVAGLLRLGELDAARDFVQWYAGQIFANGKVPCCVDVRGADPVPENDSHGQFIHAVALLWQHTRDRALVEPLWPMVDAAARYMETLRQSERSEANRQPDRIAFYGLMPASISHEGYSAKPMHSYWDDFWALAGYRDAAALARLLGHAGRADELARQRDEFDADLAASLAASVARHRIDYLPGAAELGDFDPSASTMIFSPAGAESRVPRALLESTWERYWREVEARRDGRREWKDYTPYELRSVSAFVRLGQAGRAHALLDFILADRRPAAWNQWAEVVGRAAREPRFVGDMPHAWISSDFMRSVLDLLAYERPSDGAVVLAAGVPAAWWQAAPVAVRDLRTEHGLLSFRLEREGAQTLRLEVPAGTARPPGGLWFAWAGPGDPPARTTDGRPLSWQGGLLRLPEAPLELRFPVPVAN